MVGAGGAVWVGNADRLGLQRWLCCRTEGVWFRDLGGRNEDEKLARFHLLVMHFHVCLFMQYIDCVYHCVRDSKVFDVPTLDNFGVEI